MVSICIPTYNQTKYLKKVLDSVFEQIFKDFEVIISDDSTTEDVKNLIESYQNEHENIRYFHHSPALGSPENWNFALSQANGEFIKIMHHDDWFAHKSALEIFYLTIKNNPNKLVFSSIKGYIVKDKHNYVNKPKKQVIDMVNTNPYTLLYGNFVGPPSTIIYKKDTLFYDKNLIWLVDIDFYIKQLLKNKKLHHIPDILIENIQDVNSITNNCIGNKNLEFKETIRIINNNTFKLHEKIYLLTKYIAKYLLKK